MRIISRADWGAIDAPLGARMIAKALSVTAHHSYSPALPANASREAEENAIRGIQRYHIERNGWLNIGYGFAFFQSGRVYEARGWGRVGAHAGTNTGNRTSIGCVFIINGNVETPSPAALASFYELRRTGERDGHLAIGHALKLHRDWKSTDCPGDMAAAALRERNGPDTEPRLLQRGAQGADVLALQKQLVDRGFMSAAAAATGPGTFGPATEAAVREAQRRHDLDDDGVVGKDTRRHLGL